MESNSPPAFEKFEFDPTRILDLCFTKGFAMDLPNKGIQAIAISCKASDIGKPFYTLPQALNLAQLSWVRSLVEAEKSVKNSMLEGVPMSYGARFEIGPNVSKQALLDNIAEDEKLLADLREKIPLAYQEYCDAREAQGFAAFEIPALCVDINTPYGVLMAQKHFDIARLARIISASIAEGSDAYREVKAKLSTPGHTFEITDATAIVWTPDIDFDMEDRVISLVHDGHLQATLEKSVVEAAKKLLVRKVKAAPVPAKPKKVVKTVRKKKSGKSTGAYRFGDLPDVSSLNVEKRWVSTAHHRGAMPAWLDNAEQWRLAYKAADDRMYKHYRDHQAMEGPAARARTNQHAIAGHLRNIAIERLIEAGNGP